MFDRLGYGARIVMNLAIDMAGGVESLHAEHIFLAILQLDPHLIFTKFRRLDAKAVILQVRKSVLEASGREPTSSHDPLAILHLASNIASSMPITSQHLLAAIIIAGHNTVSHYLAAKGLCLSAFVRNRFPYRASTQLISWPTETPEVRAQAWLLALIPDQALRYLAYGFVEVRSSLYQGRLYRINWENFGTEIVENEKAVAVACMHTVDPDLPNTDRVIAEYMILLGDEKFYLRTANITPV